MKITDAINQQDREIIYEEFIFIINAYEKLRNAPFYALFKISL